jgi:hypothetical protein
MGSNTSIPLISYTEVMIRKIYGRQPDLTIMEFSLKCLYQARKVSGHVYFVRRINLASFYDFSKIETYPWLSATQIFHNG